MQRPFPLIIPAFVLLASPAAAAGMFGEDYAPCGDRSNTADIVECI